MRVKQTIFPHVGGRRRVPKGLRLADTERVYQTVVAHPRLGVRAIARLARLNPGLARSHLDWLMEQRRIRAVDPYAPKYVAAEPGRQNSAPARA